tara:strand:+ start:203 stop:391 length:189 start_codon:yes stop_codon:yes gene_type:complete
MQVVLTQADFRTFERKVANILANTGEKLDYSVVGRKKREVKVTLNKDYDIEWLDANSKGVCS